MKKIVTYISLTLAAAVLSACKGFLEEAPRLDQSTDLTLSTYAGLNKATHGAYAYLATQTWYAGERILEPEMRSGNGVKNTGTIHQSNRYTTQYNWNYSAENTSSLWATGYVTISCVNNVIDNLEGKAVDGVSQQDLDNLHAECLFLRALAHFDLVTLYAQPYVRGVNNPGVPVVLHTEPAGRPARDNVGVVYDQIVADLLAAEGLIDPAYKRSGVTDEKAVVSLQAIQALLSRVYLYMGQWQNAANYATKVIKSGKFTLYDQEAYKKAWTQNVGGSEVIFEAFVDSNNYGNENPMYMCFPDGAYGDCIANPRVVEMYEDDDVRKAMYRVDKENTPDMFWTLKYAGKGLNQGADANNTVILRLSEMYLNRAEALVRGAVIDGASAQGDLNAIREKRGASPLASAGLEDCKVERRLELAWEGHYFFDLARWNQGMTRPYCPYVNKNQNVEAGSYLWALPIPKRELEVNENLKQNDKY